MADPRDDAIRKRYRELATEEPSVALDDAIRAAARRAVSSGPGAIRKPGAARWAVPASVAAVLFLSFGVVMRMEKEAPPLIEPTITTAPRMEYVPEPQPQAQPQAKLQSDLRKAPEAKAPVAKTLEREALRDQPGFAASPPPLQKEKKDTVVATDASKPAVVADAVAPAKQAAPAAPPPPAPAAAPAPQAITVPAQAASVPAPSERAAQRSYDEQRNAASSRRDEAGVAAGALGATGTRAKAEAPAAKRLTEAVEAEAPWPDTPEKKLERIEALRKAGRDKEADEAIARFRREHADYRIPDATWERIRAR